MLAFDLTGSGARKLCGVRRRKDRIMREPGVGGKLCLKIWKGPRRRRCCPSTREVPALRRAPAGILRLPESAGRAAIARTTY